MHQVYPNLMSRLHTENSQAAIHHIDCNAESYAAQYRSTII